MDESGEPGKALSDNDYFLVCMVLFDNVIEANKYIEIIDKFRMKCNLDETYEFHHSRNSKIIKKQFLKFLQDNSFKYLAVVARKNYNKPYRATNENIARALASKIVELGVVNIHMDKNNGLHKAIKAETKKGGNYVQYKEIESRGNNLVQLADYVAAATMRIVKYGNKAPVEYKRLRKRCLEIIWV